MTRPAQRLLQPLRGGGVAVLEPELQLTAEKIDDRDGTCVLALSADEPAVREPLRAQDVPGAQKDMAGGVCDHDRSAHDRLRVRPALFHRGERPARPSQNQYRQALRVEPRGLLETVRDLAELVLVHKLAAERCAPQETHARPATRSLISSLLVSGPTSTELRGLAERSGVLA
ncbi:hypothetical protein ACF08M_32320 [Streptomyces sp. NPDC015032]|uniref:hypothetical protein n=1 Tax=Streptomyces sp. NPDC015032 TaxID=3364937 RepID=UPI0036FCD577